MLKMIEGGEVTIKPESQADSHKTITLDTSNILFIAAGSFQELESIVRNKATASTMGIHSTTINEVKGDWRDSLQTDHLIRFGIIPELLGRFSTISFTDPLTKEDLTRILYEPKNSILTNYRSLFREDGVEVAFEDSLLSEVVDEAIKNSLGARGLRTGIDKRIEDFLFRISEYAGKFVVLGATGVQKVIDPGKPKKQPKARGASSA
jgi:ATP-dependent Clp protease ATP-binding subunit ClpX